MDEILKYLGTHFAQELAVITGAPIFTLITILVLGATMYFAMGAYYSHSLSAKDSIISLLEARLKHRDSESPTLPIPVASVPKKISSPALATSPVKEFTPDPARSNIVAIRGQIKMLPENDGEEIDDESGIYRQRLRGFHAFIAIFHNLPVSDRTIGSARNVTASIVYDYKGAQFAQVTKGIWLADNEESRSNQIDFHPNSVRRLILARQGDEGKFVALEDYGDSRSANVLSMAGWGNFVRLDIPTGTKCRATIQFIINGRVDQHKFHFNLGFDADHPYCGLEEESIPWDKIPF